MGENRTLSAAAYLLFYRRRSENPLGPQYLQDLVKEARNPQQTESATDDAAEESDSGEGRLGGPNGSLRGPPSALNGLGAGLANLRNGGDGGTAGAAAQVSSSLITRRSKQDGEGGIGSLNGETIYGPQRPPHMMEYGNQGSESWTFDSLDATEADRETETLITHVDDIDQGDGYQDDDALSTTAFGDDRGDEMDFVSYQPPLTSASSTTGHNTPESGTDWIDDHNMYSHQEYGDLDTLHLDDAGEIGGAEEEDLPVTDIYPGPPIFSPEHREKMD